MKHRLQDYLNYKNIEYQKGFYRCPNPAHNDEHINNCKCYTNNDGQVLTCFVCGANWDIFDVAGLLINSDNFIEQKKEVENTLGVISDYTPPVKNVNTSQQVQTPISIPLEKINEVYNDDSIREYANKNEYGQIQGKYICYDQGGKNVQGIEYRFELDNKKTVFLIWYNGKSIKWTNPPRLIFGLNEIKEGLPFLIVEGPKTREIASSILSDRFNVLTWNGGANNADKVDWKSVVGDSDVYLWPDDDEPGIKAMEKIKEMIANG